MSQAQAPTSTREPILTSMMMTSIMSIMVAGLYLLMRLGLDNTSQSEVTKVLGLSLLVINLPAVLHQLCGRMGVLGSLPTLAVITLAGVAGAGWLIHWFDLNQPMLCWAFGGTGFALFSLNLMMWLASRRIVATVLFLLFAVFVGASVGLMVYSNGVHHPMLVETLEHGNYYHGDSFFQAALANMLDTYGVSSTGLDGLVPMRYHVGSHWVLIALGHVIGISPLAALQMIFPVLFIPWFGLGLLMFAQSCLSVHHERERGQRNDGTFWIIFLLGFVGPLPLTMGLDMRLCLISTSVSESHVFSVGLLALLLAIIVHLFAALRDNARKPGDFLVLLLIVPGSLAYLTFSKISVPLVALPVAALAIVRLRLYRHWGWLAAFLVASGLCSLIYQDVVSNLTAQQQRSFPLAYFFYVIPRQWWGIFFPILLLWSGCYFWFQLRKQEITTVRAFWQSIRQRQLIDVELLLATIIVGFGPAMLYAYDGVAYFFDYQRWIGLGLVLGCLGSWKATQHADALSSIRISTVFFGLLTVCLLVIQALNSFQALQRYALELVQARAISSEQAKTWTDEINIAFRRFQLPHIIRMIRNVCTGPSMDYGHHSIGLLTKLGRLPRQERRESMVYVPKHNRDYWEILKAGAERQSTAFIAPALSGMVQFDGTPEYDPNIAWNYLGFDDYQVEKPRPPQKPWREDIENLKKRVVEKGFTQLIILDQDESGKVYLEKVQCR